MKPLKIAMLVVSVGVATALAQTVTAPGVHPVSGRRFANVMGWQGADWLERSERESEEEPDNALDALGNLAGLTVADVGAGSGYFTVRLASRVGPAGRVFANDLQSEMLKMLTARLARERVTNVRSCRARSTIRGFPPHPWISRSWSTSITSSPSRRRCCVACAPR
jgi:hypothetical protein